MAGQYGQGARAFQRHDDAARQRDQRQRRDERLFEQAYTYTGSHRTDSPQPDRSTVQPKSRAASWTPYRQALTFIQQQRAEREHAEHQAHVASLTAYLMKRTAFS